MNLLLDTHVLLWLDTDPDRLSQTSLNLIQDTNNNIFISVITAWELSIKNRLGKLPSATPLLNSYHSSLSQYSFTELNLNSTHALAERTLSSDHKDPFDRALVAQAFIENLILISNDPFIQGFTEVKIIW